MTVGARAARRYLLVVASLGVLIVIAQLVAVGLATPIDPYWEAPTGWRPPTWTWVVLVGGAVVMTLVPLWLLVIIVRHRSDLSTEVASPSLVELKESGFAAATFDHGWFIGAAVVTAGVAICASSPVGGLVGAAALLLVAVWGAPAPTGRMALKRLGLEQVAGVVALVSILGGPLMWHAIALSIATNAGWQRPTYAAWSEEHLRGVPEGLALLVVAAMLVAFAWRVWELRGQELASGARMGILVMGLAFGVVLFSASAQVDIVPWPSLLYAVLGVVGFVLRPRAQRRVGAGR